MNTGVSQSAFPDVSVLLPFRNAQDTLDQTLNSIRKQTLCSFEVVGVDDHSDDASRAIWMRYAEQDSRFRLLSSPGEGLVAALNAGLDACRGPLVARMDADDIMRPDRLRLQSQALTARPDLTLLACQVRLFPEDQIQAGYQEYIRWQNACLSPTQIANNIFVESPIAHPSVMFRRETVQRMGGYHQGDFPEDYELWLRMHAAGLRMAKLAQLLLDWRESEQRASRVDPRYSRAAFDALRARFLADYLADRNMSSPAREVKGRQIVVWGAGRRTRQRVRLLADQGVPIAAFIDIDPAKIGKRYDGATVYSKDWLVEGCSVGNPKPLVLIYVTNHGAREEISRFLEANSFCRGSDFLAVG